MKKSLLIMVILSVFLMSCPNPGGVAPTKHLGSLRLTFSTSEMTPKTLIPPLDMKIASYSISGSGPSSATFLQTGVTGASFVQSALPVGDWTIAVAAFNAGNNVIGAGGTTVTIEEGQTSVASVTVTPLSGTGTLTINISWTAGLVAVPSVVATLTPMGGSAQNLPFTMGANSASYSSGNTLNAGYYSLALQLMDGGVSVWGLYDAVLILQGQTTAASANLTSQDLHTGGINLTIVPALPSPIAVTFSGQQSQIPPGTDMTITASTSESPVTFQWYLGGVPLPGQTSSSLTIGSSLTPGNYRLDLAVSNGSALGSGSVVFSVLNPPQAFDQTNLGQAGAKLNVYFYGGTQFTTYNALYTIWVEDMNGAFLQDLFACNSAGTNVYPYSAAWVARPQSVPYWAYKACREDPYGYVGNTSHNTAGMYLALPTVDAMGGTSIPSDLDAVTGATRRVNFELQTARKNDGISQFQVLLEIDQSYDYNTFYNSIDYYPGGQPSTVYRAVIDTNSSQRFYTMSLFGTGSALGSDGLLHDTSQCTTALNIVGTVIIYLPQ